MIDDQGAVRKEGVKQAARDHRRFSRRSLLGQGMQFVWAVQGAKKNLHGVNLMLTAPLSFCEKNWAALPSWTVSSRPVRRGSSQREKLVTSAQVATSWFRDELVQDGGAYLGPALGVGPEIGRRRERPTHRVGEAAVIRGRLCPQQPSLIGREWAERERREEADVRSARRSPP
jgi:hypothetical protein